MLRVEVLYTLKIIHSTFPIGYVRMSHLQGWGSCSVCSSRNAMDVSLAAHGTLEDEETRSSAIGLRSEVLYCSGTYRVPYLENLD